MKILLTGGTSLLGAETVRQLLDAGHQVRSLQRSPSNREGPGFEEHLGAIEDREAVDRAMVGMDRVIHLAARVGVVGSADQFQRTNVDGTRNIIRSAVANDLSGMVQVSTPSVAHSGASLHGAAAEPADPTTCRGAYARSKAQAELLALGASSPNFPVVAIRPHLVIGPGDTQLVGRIVSRAAAGRLAWIGSGQALVDTVWVDNAAAALVAAVTNVARCASRAYVVSNGEPRPIRELVERILDCADVPADARQVSRGAALRAGALVDSIWPRLAGRVLAEEAEPPLTRFLAEQLSTAHWFDQRAVRADLNWQPHVSLDEGFRRLSAWFADQSS